MFLPSQSFNVLYSSRQSFSLFSTCLSLINTMYSLLCYIMSFYENLLLSSQNYFSCNLNFTWQNSHTLHKTSSLIRFHYKHKSNISWHIEHEYFSSFFFYPDFSCVICLISECWLYMFVVTLSITLSSEQRAKPRNCKKRHVFVLSETVMLK